MSMRTALLMGVIAVGACSAPPPPPPPAQVAAGVMSCINSDQVAARRVVGPDTLEFEMIGGLTYRNKLAQECPGMSRLGGSAVIESISRGQGPQMCRGDQIRVYDPVEVKAAGAGSAPVCVLGDFAAVPR